jgi:hypothetical protein
MSPVVIDLTRAVFIDSGTCSLRIDSYPSAVLGLTCAAFIGHHSPMNPPRVIGLGAVGNSPTADALRT